MPQSYKKRRERERPLRDLRRRVLRDIDSVYSALGDEIDASERDRLADELVRRSDPWAYRGIDAPLPAHLSEPRRTWLILWRAGVISTEADRERYARMLSPAPDYDYNRVEGFGGPGYEPVRQAFLARRRRLRIPDDQPTFPPTD